MNLAAAKVNSMGIGATRTQKAKVAQLTIDGETVPGRVLERELFGREGSSCCLALSETWTIPPDHEWAADAL